MFLDRDMMVNIIALKTKLNKVLVTFNQFSVYITDNKIKRLTCKWRYPSLSELTPMVFNMELTHLGSDASKLA